MSTLGGTPRRTGQRGAGAVGTIGRTAAAGRGSSLADYERSRTSIMIGGAVRAARRRAGVSQVELARRAGTSQPSIARLERGMVSPTVITLDRIARALGTDLVIDFEPQSARA